MNKPKVLLVEDVPLAQKIAVLVLKRLGCEVGAASDGQSALDMAENQSYDLIFMDLGLPDMTAEAVISGLRRIEQAHHRKRSPIVVLTAHSESSYRARCADLAVEGYLEKPLTVVSAKKTLQQFIQEGVI